MSKLLIPVFTNPAYTINWQNLAKRKGPDDRLVLVANAESIKVLTETDRQAFAEIIDIGTLTTETLLDVMRQIQRKHYKPGDETRICAPTELDQEPVAEVRDGLRKELNIVGPGLEAIRRFRNKLDMKADVEAKDIPVPKYVRFQPDKFIKDSTAYLTAVEDQLGFPMFIKPVDGASSIGTAKINNAAELLQWCETHQVEKQEYEIDKFIDGILYHCDSICENGEVKFTFVSQYLHPNADVRKGLALATRTMNPEDPKYKLLQEFTKKALLAFAAARGGLPDGCTHLEVFIVNEGGVEKIYFLEVGCRPSGARGPEMLSIRTGGRYEEGKKLIVGGVDMRELHYHLGFGFNIDEILAHLNDNSKWGPFAGMWDIINPSLEGTLDETFTPQFSSDFEERWYVKLNQDVTPGNSNASSILGSVIFWNENYEALERDLLSIDDQTLVTIKPKVVGPGIMRRSSSELFKLEAGRRDREQIPPAQVNGSDQTATARR